MRAAMIAAMAWLAAGLAGSSDAGAAQLLVLERPCCVWCARFESEIAPAWPNTPEGKRAPLRRIDITQPWPAELPGIAAEQLTPTFILIDEGREIARLRGYPGDIFFWTSIGELLKKLPETALAGIETQTDQQMQKLQTQEDGQGK